MASRLDNISPFGDGTKDGVATGLYFPRAQSDSELDLVCACGLRSPQGAARRISAWREPGLGAAWGQVRFGNSHPW
jgi:hypothetical protein